jgi:hypothetical protein
LKEGERGCGGRGQFGKKPLWDLNTISKVAKALERSCRSVLMNCERSQRVESPVIEKGKVPEDARIRARIKVRTPE